MLLQRPQMKRRRYRVSTQERLPTRETMEGRFARLLMLQEERARRVEIYAALVQAGRVLFDDHDFNEEVKGWLM